MRTAIFLRNIIGKAQHFFVIRIGPLERNFDTDTIVLLTGKMEYFIDTVFACIDIADKL